MEDEKYCYFMEKSQELQELTKNEFNKQLGLSQDCKVKMKEFYELEDKVIELFKQGAPKVMSLLPEACEIINNSCRFDNLLSAASEFAADSDIYKRISKAMNSVPEFVEAGKLESKRVKLFIDYATSVMKLDNYLNDSKDKLFSKEYIEKMYEYAEHGIFLFFLETPDFPILDPKISEQDFLDALLYGNCMSLKTLFESFVNSTMPGKPLKRKIEDLYAVMDNLEKKYYRTAARTLFAMLDSEHKNVARVYNGFIDKEKKLINGYERARKIEEFVKYSDMTRIKQDWERINKYYEKIVTSGDLIIDRNALIHGDYESNKMDISSYEVVKIMLLYLSFRMLGDYIQTHAYINENMILYAVTLVAQETKKRV